MGVLAFARGLDCPFIVRYVRQSHLAAPIAQARQTGRERKRKRKGDAPMRTGRVEKSREEKERGSFG